MSWPGRRPQLISEFLRYRVIGPATGRSGRSRQYRPTSSVLRRKTMRTRGILGVILSATLLLAGCGGGTNGGGASNPSGVGLKKTIAVPNVGAGTNFAF